MREMNIKLGYEIGTGQIVTVKPSHIIATGITQLSGKTTTEEALIRRSGRKAIVFKTKVGETGFTEGIVIPPYYQERSDWQYVSSLLEATLKERLKFERAWIINVCKNANSLLEVKANIDRRIAEGKLNQLSLNIYTTLQAYFELVLPQLQYANFSRTLTLHEGINIMDLERYSEEIQSLVIRSVLEIVLKEFKDVIVVIPEAWKFLPQGRGNPCKSAAEAFIRQGATNGNYLWVDSQDLAGVDKTPLKQVSTWILGLQQERNEVVHTLDQIPLPKRQKPKPEEIMTLSIGHFILATPEKTVKVYVQPAWLDDQAALKVALGEIDITKIEKPKSSVSVSTPIETPPKAALPDLEAKINEMRDYFLNQIAQLRGQVDDLAKRISSTTTGMVIYEVAPLEKLQKDFLEEAKTKILQDIGSLDEEQKKMLKFIEVTGRGTNVTEILEKCLFLSTTSGGTRSRINGKLSIMSSLELIRKDQGGHIYANLKLKIQKHLEIFSGTPEEIEAVYNHIVMQILANNGYKNRDEPKR